jgi:hypothetical protein
LDFLDFLDFFFLSFLVFLVFFLAFLVFFLAFFLGFFFFLAFFLGFFFLAAFFFLGFFFLGAFLASADSLYLPPFLTKKPASTPFLRAALMYRHWSWVAPRAFLMAGRDDPVRLFRLRMTALICSLLYGKHYKMGVAVSVVVVSSPKESYVHCRWTRALFQRTFESLCIA